LTLDSRPTKERGRILKRGASPLLNTPFSLYPGLVLVEGVFRQGDKLSLNIKRFAIISIDVVP